MRIFGSPCAPHPERSAGLRDRQRQSSAAKFSGKVKISKRNLPVPRMWLANPHAILQGGFSLSRAKAVFIPPAELVVVARSSCPMPKSPCARETPAQGLWFCFAFSWCARLPAGGSYCLRNGPGYRTSRSVCNPGD